MLGDRYAPGTRAPPPDGAARRDFRHHNPVIYKLPLPTLERASSAACWWVSHSFHAQRLAILAHHDGFFYERVLDHEGSLVFQRQVTHFNATQFYHHCDFTLVRLKCLEKRVIPTCVQHGRVGRSNTAAPCHCGVGATRGYCCFASGSENNGSA